MLHSICAIGSGLNVLYNFSIVLSHFALRRQFKWTVLFILKWECVAIWMRVTLNKRFSLLRLHTHLRNEMFTARIFADFRTMKMQWLICYVLLNLFRKCLPMEQMKWDLDDGFICVEVNLNGWKTIDFNNVFKMRITHLSK